MSDEIGQAIYFFGATCAPPAILTAVSFHISRKRKAVNNQLRDAFLAPLFFAPTILLLIYDKSLLFLIMFFHQAAGIFFFVSVLNGASSGADVETPGTSGRFSTMMLGAYIGAAVGFVITYFIVSTIIVANQ